MRQDITVTVTVTGRNHEANHEANLSEPVRSGFKLAQIYRHHAGNPVHLSVHKEIRWHIAGVAVIRKLRGQVVMSMRVGDQTLLHAGCVASTSRNLPVSDMKRAEESLAQKADTQCVRQRESKSDAPNFRFRIELQFRGLVFVR